MTLAIIGPGLVGSFLGAAAGATHVVVGPSGAVRANRVLLNGRVQEWKPQRLTAFALRDRSGPVLVATRVPDTPWTITPASALLAQNGLGQRMPVITCFFGLDVDAHGVLKPSGPPPRIVLARPPKEWDGVLQAWSKAGIAVDICADARPAQWEKTILNATVGPLCLATGMSMAEVWNTPSLNTLTLDAIDEGAAIAASCGVTCEPNMRQRAREFFSLMGSHRPSLLSKANELACTLGYLLDRARVRALSCPSLDCIQRMAAARLVTGRASARRHALASRTSFG